MNSAETGSEAIIDRGKVTEKWTIGGRRYRIASLGRPGVITQWIEAVNDGEGGYAIGEMVYFFMFADGRGMVLGRVTV